jgi:glycine betaine/proline transport system substrate-binding protein
VNRARKLLAWVLAFAGAALAPFAQAADPCPGLRLGSVGWLDAGASASLVSALSQGLGYPASIQKLSAPTIFNSLKSRDLDASMEVMVPTMGAALKPYLLDDSVSLLRRNLSGTKYTLATNSAGRKLGIESFADIAAHRQALGATILGIEPGSDGNTLIRQMIDEDRFGMAGFTLMESSEADLVARVTDANREQRPLVFLAWEPHPMNLRFEIHWLSGGDDVFGANFGGADVYTGIRASLEGDCSNLHRLLANIELDLDMINEIMTAILELGARPLVAAITWLRQNPSRFEPWLSGVKDRDGGDGPAAVRRFIGLAEPGAQ